MALCVIVPEHFLAHNKAFTIFFDLKLGIKALLRVALELGHYFPESRTANEHIC